MERVFTLRCSNCAYSASTAVEYCHVGLLATDFTDLHGLKGGKHVFIRVNQCNLWQSKKVYGRETGFYHLMTSFLFG